MPRVAVVIPAYNPGDFLRRSLDSVLSQTMVDLECVVVDDGSTEDLSWVDGVPDARVRLVRQPNRGVSVARNRGVEATTAELVAFLDQDDQWRPAKLQRQVDAMEASPDSAFCCTAFAWVKASGSERAPVDKVTYLGLLSDQHVCLSSVVLTRAAYVAVGGHDPLLRQMQDFDLFLKLLHVYPAPVCIDEALVDYHLHDANTSSDYRTASDERLSILDRHGRLARLDGRDDTVAAVAAGLRRTRQLYAWQAMDQARAARRKASGPAVSRHLVAATRLSPAVVLLSTRLLLSRTANRVMHSDPSIRRGAERAWRWPRT